MIFPNEQLIADKVRRTKEAIIRENFNICRREGSQNWICKHKGRDFKEAKTDQDLKSYLQWLADSENKRSLGKWYLDNLKFESPPPCFRF